MDYFRKYLAVNPNDEPSGAETIDRLVDRAQSSTLIDDRRDAMRALKSLSRKFRLEVGTQAMHIILDVLERDSSDTEIVGYGLETIHNIMSDESGDEKSSRTKVETNQLVNLPEDLGGQFTEMFLKKGENMQLMLSFVDAYDFHVRRHAVRLLIVLLSNRPKEVQEAILMCPMGVSKLLDLLCDSREVVRNDGILLLMELTQGNTNIQKIVAFENVFERILSIVKEEDNSDGGVIVEDCLRLLLQLLKNNAPNQTLFKEGGYIRVMTDFFDLSSDDTESQKGWSAQKVANLQLMLQVVRTLVSPSNKNQATKACQQTMLNCGLLSSLCGILMASGVPADVLTETIHTVGEAVRGFPGNQIHLSEVMAPSDPPQPAITVLLMSMVNERQPFVLRSAVLYCFQCYLYNNKAAQSQVVQTLLPKSTTEVSSMSAGQLLCGGLFSHDALSAWFAATALLHSIHNNTQLKEELLRVHLATTLGSRPVTLLQQCCNLLSQGIRFQAKVGLLMFLCTWLASCPTAVRKFIIGCPSAPDSPVNSQSSGGGGVGANVSTLIGELSAVDSDETEMVVRGLCALLLGICVKNNPGDVKGYESASIIQSIERRVGVDVFIERLNQVSKCEAYTKAMKRPQPSFKQGSEVVFDFEFTRLFKFLEHEVVNALQQNASDESPEEQAKKMAQFAEHENVVLQYKELIKEQDDELRELRARISQFESTSTGSQEELMKLKDELQKLKDQNVLLKASKGPANSTARRWWPLIGTGSLPSLTDSSGPEGENVTGAEPAGAASGMEEAKLRELEISLQAKDNEIQKLRNEITTLQSATPSSQDSAQDWMHKYQELQAKFDAERSSVSGAEFLQAENASLKERIRQLEEKTQEASKLKDNLTTLESRVEEAEKERDEIKTEHEELMVLLSDQDEKLKELKATIKKLGGQVSDEDEDEDDIGSGLEEDLDDES